jgi:cytochrome P450
VIDLATFDPFAPEALEQPYEYYRALRAKPHLHYVTREGYFIVSRYDDARRVALDPVAFSSNLLDALLSARHARSLAPVVRTVGPVDVLATADPPTHTKQRKVISRQFGREAIRALEPAIRVRSETLVDAFVAAGGGDVMPALANALPVWTTLQALGLPAADFDRVKAWSDASVDVLGGLRVGVRFAKVAASALAFYAYSRRAVAKWHAARQLTPVAQAMIDGIEGGTISNREAASFVMQLLIAGSDSTASLIGSSIAMLAQSEPLAVRLREDPSLVPTFMEEVTRLETPFQGHFRVVTRDVDLAGTTLRRGQRLMVLWAAANRDENAFSEPDVVRFDRPSSTPHLGFGHGIHLCIGAALARSQTRVLIETLLAKTLSMAAATSRMRHRPSVFTRTLASLPVHVRAKPRLSRLR